MAGVLQRIRNAIIGRRRAAARTMAGRAPARRATGPRNRNGRARLALPAEARARPLELGRADFEAGNPIQDTASILARHTVPRLAGEALRQDVPFRMQLYSHYRAEDVTVAGGGEYVADLGTQDVTIMEPGRGGDAAAVRVYVNGSRVATSDLTIDYDANTVEIADSAVSAGDDVDVYALERAGGLRLMLLQPAGVDVRRISLYHSDLESLHGVDQAEAETAPRLWHGRVRDIPLINKSRLELEIDSPAPFDWSDDARHVVKLPAYAVAMTVLSQRALQRWTQEVLR